MEADYFPKTVHHKGFILFIPQQFIKDYDFNDVKE